MSDLEAWVQKWFEKADRDLEMARMAMSRDVPFGDMACFHAHPKGTSSPTLRAQQCVEKYPKGFLTDYQKEIEKTHDLALLLNLCAAIDASFEQWRYDCLELRTYAVEVRYPDDPEISEGKAAAALDAAARVRRFTRERMPFDVP